jgi:hypothetical protein
MVARLHRMGTQTVKSINGIIGVITTTITIPALYLSPAFIPHPYSMIFGVAMISLAVTGFGIALIWAYDESHDHND